MAVISSLYRKYPIALLLVICVLVFLVNLDALYVTIMEARNFITAREMLVHDNWIFTTMNEEARYQKPPLPTWITALFAAVWGIGNIYAYRLPAALASIIMVFYFYRIQLILGLKRSIAFGSSVILSTSFYVFFLGREGQWDIFTHSFMVVSIYYFILLVTTTRQQNMNAVIAGIFLGASILSKGPVSLYALFLPFLLSYSFTYKFEQIKSKWKSLLLFLIAGLITGTWWSLAVHYYDAAEFARIAAIESDRWFNYNIRPFWYYWSFFTQSGIWTIPALAGLLYWYLKSKVSNPKAYKFYFFWTIFSVILLSVIPEKKSRYLLPALIPLAVCTAFYVEYIIRNFKTRLGKWEKLPVYLNFGVLAAISLAAPVALYILLGENLDKVTVNFILFTILFLCLGAGFIYGLVKNKIKILFCLQAGVIILLITVGLPMLKIFDPSGHTPNITELQAEVSTRNLPVFDFHNMMPELIWEYGEAIPTLEKKDSPPPEANFILLVETQLFPDWEEYFPGYDSQPLGTINLNPTYTESGNPRLMRSYYLLSKPQH